MLLGKDWIRLLNNKQQATEYFELVASCVPDGQIFLHEPMSRHTTFKIGGPADCLVLPTCPEQAAAVLKLAAQQELPLTVIGKGSNLLVRDKGIRGLVLKIGEPMATLRCEGQMIIAGAGAMLAEVAKFAAECGLSGMEFAVGIPGSIGGAVFMNAGAYDGDMSKVVERVTAVCTDGSSCDYLAAEILFGYRHSVFQDNHCVICEVRLKLSPGDRQQIEARMVELTERRESRQPIEWPSAGSTFRRPPGFFVGTLVEQSGCKGICCGDAKVSDKHAGFIINAGKASAAEVQELIRTIQEQVEAKTGVKLWPEVVILGEE